MKTNYRNLTLRCTSHSLLFVGTTLLGLLLSAAGCGSGSGDSPTLSLGDTPNQSTTKTSSEPEKPKFNPNPEVEVKTSGGTFVLKLDTKKAPLTVNNFLHYVKQGSYDKTLFHEVYRDFIVLGGGFDEKLTPRPTELPIRNEAHNGLKNTRGTIAMARSKDGIDSATNQFFINLSDNSALDYVGTEPSEYGYCVFGEVISGMDVIDLLGKAEVAKTEQFENAPVQPIVIESMKVLK